MNIFYTPPEYIEEERLELVGKEAKHVAKVLRYREKDTITVVDGRGGFYEGIIHQINRNSVVVNVNRRWTEDVPQPDIRLGLSIIKKKDRLEFAVEKAVELGVRHLYFFESEHSEKSRVRTDRLEKIALSAMKQSLRGYKPDVFEASGIEQTLAHCANYKPVEGHQKGDPASQLQLGPRDKILLLIGPEGGFSNRETKLIQQEGGGKKLSLGSKRLRAETAALVGIAKMQELR